MAASLPKLPHATLYKDRLGRGRSYALAFWQGSGRGAARAKVQCPCPSPRGYRLRRECQRRLGCKLRSAKPAPPAALSRGRSFARAKLTVAQFRQQVERSLRRGIACAKVLRIKWLRQNTALPTQAAPMESRGEACATPQTLSPSTTVGFKICKL